MDAWLKFKKPVSREYAESQNSDSALKEEPMKHLLLVEDDPNTTRAVRLRLESPEYEVSWARTAEEALTLTLGIEFDLFIVDVGLPGLDGIALAEQLIHSPKARLKPVLFLTGCMDFTRRLRATSVGAFGWLEKPYNPEDLQRAVQMALGEYRAGSFKQNPFAPLKPLIPKAALRRKVLLIEDDRSVAAALKVRLEAADFEAIVAYDGPQGLRFAREFQPDLILSDIRMPGGLGFTIFDHLKTIGSGSVPVIFLTASRKPGLREAAIEQGARGFFEKPFNPAELLRSIRQSIPESNRSAEVGV